jgi:hypothetical protein
MTTVTCPECGPLDIATVIGIKILGVYDGTLIWRCPDGHEWPRFPDGHRLHQRALDIISRPPDTTT